MLKSIINHIHNKQLENFYKISEFKNHLKTKQRGLYWIWTNLTDEELLKLEPAPKDSLHVPIRKLVTNRKDLNCISVVGKDGFRVIYNGIGGYKKVPAAFGLRERINQELSCNDLRTGTLNLKNRGFNKENWAISFFNFDDPNNAEKIKHQRTIFRICK